MNYGSGGEQSRVTSASYLSPSLSFIIHFLRERENCVACVEKSAAYALAERFWCQSSGESPDVESPCFSATRAR